MKKFLKRTITAILAVGLLTVLCSTAFAEGLPELHIKSLEDVPESGEYSVIYIDAEFVGNISLENIKADKLIIIGSNSVKVGKGCSVATVQVEYIGDAALALDMTDADAVENVTIESSSAEVSVSGNVTGVELKADNVVATVVTGSAKSAVVTGKQSTLVIDTASVSQKAEIAAEAVESKIIVRGNCESLSVHAEKSEVSIEGGNAAEVMVYEDAADTKVSVSESGSISTIASDAGIEIITDETSKVDTLVISEAVEVKGEDAVEKTVVEEKAIVDDKPNLNGETENREQSSEPNPPEGAEASIGSTYYEDLQTALDADGNVKLLADQYLGSYQILAYKPISYYNATKNGDSMDAENWRIDVWDAWGMQGMVDADGNECPQYLPINDETKYRDTAVDEGDDGDWISGKEIADYYSDPSGWSRFSSVFVNIAGEKEPVWQNDHDMVIAEESQAIDMNGHTLYKTDESGEGLRMGGNYNGDATENQTFYVENGSFVAEDYTYDYQTDTWTDDGEANTATVMEMQYGSTYIVKDCDFQSGDVHLNMNDDDDNSTVTELSFDGCDFSDTRIDLDAVSGFGNLGGAAVNINFNGCTFEINPQQNSWEYGIIDINYYLFGNINFSNCKFNVDQAILDHNWNKAIQVQANAGSNGDHDLTITFESSELNGEAITVESANSLVYNSSNGGSNDVTTVIVAPDGIEGNTETAMDHTDTNQTVDNPDAQSAEANTVAMEQEAETVLDVEIVG